MQHPGQPSAQSIQSVAVHLIRLCLLLEQGLDMPHANAAMLTAVKSKGIYTWLVPPPTLGSMTIADVHRAKDAEEHKRLVRAWAASAWSAWSPHHAALRQWLPKVF